MKTENTKADVYTRVTDKIIASLEAGTRPWMQPWQAGAGAPFPLRGNGQPYRGVNVLLLWAEAVERAFGFMKAYTVFNVEQIDGLDAGFYPVEDMGEDAGEAVELIDRAETFFTGTGAIFRHGGYSAFYAPGPDVIQLPPARAFRDAESYAAAKAHELIHWTGHQDRMAREFGKRYGDRAYAFEELVAEMGAAFLCADLAITPELRDDHADYLAAWLDVMKEDKRAIFAAASHAQKAMDFLHGLQAAAPVQETQLELFAA